MKNLAETTARAGDVRPTGNNNLKNKAIGILVALLLAPLSLVSFTIGFIMYAFGRMRPSVILQVGILSTAFFFAGGWLTTSIENAVPNFMSLLKLVENFDPKIIVNYALNQGPITIPLGFLIASLYAAIRKSGMREAERDSYFRDTPIQYMRKQKNIKKVKTGAAQYDNKITMGIEKGTGQIFTVGYDDLSMHTFVIGSTGSGKTVTIMTMAEKYIKDQHALIMIDLKGDAVLANNIARMCEENGAKFHHVVTENMKTKYKGPSKYGRALYNPLARGDYDHLSDLIITMLPKTEGTNAEIYTRHAHGYLKTLFHTLELIGPEAVGDEGILQRTRQLLYPDRLKMLGNEIPESEEGRAVRISIADACAQYSKDKTYQSALAGVSATITTLYESAAGNYLKSPTKGEDYVDLEKIARNGEVVLFSLDGSSSQVTSSYIAKYIIEDLKLLSSELNNRPSDYITNVIIDEFSVVSDDNLIGLINKSRSANMPIVLSAQTTEDLKETSETFVKRVCSNVNVIMAMNMKTFAEADLISKSFGDAIKEIKTSKITSEKRIISTNKSTMTGEESIREEEGFLISASDLMKQKQGEMWIRVANKDISKNVKIIPGPDVIMDSDKKARILMAQQGDLVEEFETPQQNKQEESHNQAFTAYEPTRDEILKELDDYKKKQHKTPHTPQGWVPDTTTSPKRREPAKPARRRGIAPPPNGQASDHKPMNRVSGGSRGIKAPTPPNKPRMMTSPVWSSNDDVLIEEIHSSENVGNIISDNMEGDILDSLEGNQW